MSNEYVEAVLKEELAKQGLTKPEEPPAAPAPAEGAKPPAPKMEEPVKAPEGAPDTIKQSFAKLAEQKAAFRAEQERLKPFTEALKALDPQSLSALARAKAAGDPVAALAAMGFTHNDYVNRFVDGEKPAAKAKEPEKAPEQLGGVEKDLAEFKAWRAQQAQAQTLGAIKDLTKDFPHIAKLERHDLVLQELLDFIGRTGAPPSEDFQESVKMAAQAVEDKLKAEAQKWAKVLTPGAPTGSVPPEVKGTSDSPASGREIKTVTNDVQAQPRTGVRPVPQSDEDYRRDALRFLETGE